MNAARELIALAFAIGLVLRFGSLFFQGLRQRKAVLGINLLVERNERPVLYWVTQSGYALGTVGFACAIGLVAFGHALMGTSALDKAILAIFGLTSMLAVVMIANSLVTGLRSGVAVGRLGFEGAPPTRKANPIAFWAIQLVYVFFIGLTSLMGLALLIVAVLK